LDQILADVLEERFKVARALAKEKKDLNMSIEDSDQEEKVLDRIENMSGDPDLRDIFSEILDVSKKKMRDQIQ